MTKNPLVGKDARVYKFSEINDLSGVDPKYYGRQGEIIKTLEGEHGLLYHITFADGDWGEFYFYEFQVLNYSPLRHVVNSIEHRGGKTISIREKGYAENLPDDHEWQGYNVKKLTEDRVAIPYPELTPVVEVNPDNLERSR